MYSTAIPCMRGGDSKANVPIGTKLSIPHMRGDDSALPIHAPGSISHVCGDDSGASVVNGMFSKQIVRPV